MALTLTPLQHFPLIQPGADLADVIWQAMQQNGIQLEAGDIFVLAQKIVSKAEGRLMRLSSVTPSAEAMDLAPRVDKDPRFVELVLRESKAVIRYRPGTLIVEHRLGFICANAGIDHSNVQGIGGEADDWVLLLPQDADASAQRLVASLSQLSGTSPLGALIIDSHGRAWRNGVIGTTIGLAGVPGLVDLRGQPDLFGFNLKITQVGAADELAAAASLVMGQAAEGTPVVHVRGFPYPLRPAHLTELLRPVELDLFR